jgi:hypothetical protein
VGHGLAGAHMGAASATSSTPSSIIVPTILGGDMETPPPVCMGRVVQNAVVAGYLIFVGSGVNRVVVFTAHGSNSLKADARAPALCATC